MRLFSRTPGQCRAWGEKVDAASVNTVLVGIDKIASVSSLRRDVYIYVRTITLSPDTFVRRPRMSVRGAMQVSVTCCLVLLSRGLS